MNPTTQTTDTPPSDNAASVADTPASDAATPAQAPKKPTKKSTKKPPKPAPLPIVQRVRSLLLRGTRAVAAGLLWLAIWLPGAVVALLLASAVALWFWSATPDSLNKTLSTAQNLSERYGNTLGQLEVSQVSGSLRTGGQIGQLQWSRQGLTVQARDVRLALGSQAWLNVLKGRGLHLQALAVGQLHIDDRSPPSPLEIPTSLSLPLDISVPWSVGELVWQGPQTLRMQMLQGAYRYGALEGSASTGKAHQLSQVAWRFAGGQYNAEATLGAQTPLPLSLSLQAQLVGAVPGGESVPLQMRLQAQGELGTLASTIDLNAQLQPASTATASPNPITGPGPLLDAQVRLMPWAAQPLVKAAIRSEQLNLVTLWPWAPVTALSGTVQAQPDGEHWRAQVRLHNSLSGPADLQRLPLQKLHAQVVQQGSRWTINALDAEIGGGRITGDAQIHQRNNPRRPPSSNTAAALGDDWQSRLQISNINPALLWSTLAPASLGGHINAQTVRGAVQPGVTIDTVIQPSGRQPSNAAGLRLRELRLQGLWQPRSGPRQGLLRLDTAQLSLADAEFSASGQFDTTNYQFDGQLALQWPGADLQIKGLLGHNTGDAQAHWVLSDAQHSLDWLRSLQTLPGLGPTLRDALEPLPRLTAQGNAEISTRWIGGLGALGYPSTQPGAVAGLPRVNITLDISNLVLQTDSNDSLTRHALGGVRLHSEGRMDDLPIVLVGSYSQAHWSSQINLQGQLHSIPISDLNTEHWHAGRFDLNRLMLRITDNSRQDRQTQWSVQNAQPFFTEWQPTDQGLHLRASGGRMQVLPTVRPLNAQAPAALDLGSDPLNLTWERLVWHNHTLETRGNLRDLPLAWLEVLGTAEGAKSGPLSRVGLSGNLVLEGAWDLTLPTDDSAPLRLSASLQRSRGDLTVLSNESSSNAGNSGQRIQAEIRQAELSINAQGRNVQASLRWDSQRLGQASADLSTEINPHPNNNGPNAAGKTSQQTLDDWWPLDAPLQGSFSAQLPQVSVWSGLAPPGWRMQGTLQAQASLSGTRSDPQLSGQLSAEQLGLRSLVDGFAFSNGQLRATLASDKITIEHFRLQGPGGSDTGGTFEASGSAEWRSSNGTAHKQAFINLQASARQLRVSNRADRRLSVSGDVKVQLAGPNLQLRGQLSADSAYFELPDQFGSSLGQDVVLRGDPRNASDTDSEPMRPDVQIDLDLGQRFELRGQGLQTRLAGQLRVQSSPAMPAPRILGEVRAVSGTYRAYGQQLSIDTGVLRFTGPYDDPTLDILAIRPQPVNQEQRVGVQISGTAQIPRLRLYAEPELPDSEKLAWLILGRPATGVGAEAAVLQQAAMALLARNNSGAEAGIASTFGLDELGIRGESTNSDGSTNAAAVTLGKRLSNKFYLAYERSLASTAGTVSVFYDVSRRLTLRARAGEESAIDLIFRLRYD
ncbi:MAG: hypothetical protein RLZZ352_672 [Pseudomonadota bacterium]|jgi:translocation and assembly module TamB